MGDYIVVYPNTWEYFFEDHEKGNKDCDWCRENYPKLHDCGGLVHYQIVAEDYNNYIYIRCDECGFQEEL